MWTSQQPPPEDNNSFQLGCCRIYLFAVQMRIKHDAMLDCILITMNFYEVDCVIDYPNVTILI